MMMSEFMNGSEHENNNEQQSDGITPLNLTNGNDGMPQGMNAAADAVQEHGNGNASEHIVPDMAERNSAGHAAQPDAGQGNGMPDQVQTAGAAAVSPDGTYRYSYRQANDNMQGAYAADQIGCAYTTNGQYAHYQMHHDGVQPNAGFDKKAMKAQKKAQKKQMRAAKKQERRAKGRYPLGMRMASALLCGVLFAGAAYGTCYGIEQLTGTKLIVNGRNGYTQVASTPNVNGPALSVPQTTQDSGVIATDTAGNTAQGMDIRAVAKSVQPAVVTITNFYTQTIDYWMYQYEQEGEGGGSGIIVGQNDDELLICTNYHVIDKAHDLQVTFIDDTTVDAVVKGTDAGNDLAVIAIPLKDISEETLSQIAIARLGDSNQLEVGEEVIAIGNALGYGQSVTNGIISALDRKLEDYESPMIQTNAAINPGNSGGALVNARGEVVGIPSAKIGGSAVEGMGYAIPISVAEPILRDLMTRETKTMVAEEERGYLGVTVVDVDEQGIQLYNMPRGVYIYEISEGQAADRAGLRRGDIITALNGTKIEDKVALVDELKYYSAGTTVTLTVCRIANDYESEEVQVVLGEAVTE